MKCEVHKYIITFIIILNWACVKAGPVILERGKEQCAHCSMSIVDMRFHAQALTTKGRRFYFDSIECYYDFKRNKHIVIDRSWFSNYVLPSEMIDESQAIVIRSSKIRSPMGGGLAAFKSKKESEGFLLDQKK